MARRGTPGLGLALCVTWVMVGFLLAPLLVSIPLSLTPERYLSMPHGEVSLRHYQTLFTDDVWLHAIGSSLLVGVGAMVVATLAGAAAAIGVWQIGGRSAQVVGVIALTPLIVPPIVTALALSRAWVALGLFDTFAGVVLSHAILGMPFVFMTVSASLEGLDRRIAQAGRSLGAGPFRAVCDVVLPNIRLGLLSGALFAFMTSWDEIVVTLFVSSRSVYTLPRKIWSDIRDNLSPEVAAVSSLLILMTAAVAAAVLLRDVVRARFREAA